MTNKTTPAGRLGMAVAAIIAGLLLCTLVPATVAASMERVLAAAHAKITATGNPAMVPAPRLVAFFFPLWGALGMVAGAALLLLSVPIYRGEAWGRAMALGLLAIPSVGGAYMTGPIMFFDKAAITGAVVTMMVGLVPYFTILLWEQASRAEKWANFFVFLLLGVSAAYNFSNGHSSLRQLLGRPDPKVLDAGQQALALGIPADWVGAALVLVAIPLLALRTRAGWWLAAIGSLAMTAGSGTLYLQHPQTVEFLVGISLAVASLVLLLLPAVGGRRLGAAGLTS